MSTVVFLLIASWLILQSPAVQTYLTQKLAVSLSEKYNTTITIKGVSIGFFDKLVLKDVLIEDQKKDSLLYVHNLVAEIDSFSFKKRFVSIGTLSLNKTFVNVDVDSAGIYNYQFLIPPDETKDTLKTGFLNLDIILKNLEFNQAKFRYSYHDSVGMQSILLDNISLEMSDLAIQQDRIAFQINQLQMDNQKDFMLQDFSASLSFSPDSVILKKLKFQTLNSHISEANLWIDKSKIGPDLDLKKLKIEFDLQESGISLKDIGLLIPSLKGMDENVQVSGQISGTMTDLKGKNIELSINDNTRLAFDFYLNGLPDLANTYMHLDLKQSFVNFKELSQVKLPDNFPLTQLKIPSQLIDVGVMEYNGNFTGFLSDFVAYGTFQSKWGVINTDLSFVPSDREQLKINGSIKTVDFQLGKLLKTEELGRITFRGDIKGLLNQKTHNFKATVAGKIDSLYANSYLYRNINLMGDVLNKEFDGSLVVDDPNLRLRFDGKFDLNVPVPVFNFEMLVEKADLKKLNLVGTYAESEISFALNANFIGNNIDDLAGFIHFREGKYKNENGDVRFDNFDLKTSNDEEPVLQVRSDFMDVDIRGQYQLHHLNQSVRQIVSHFLPSSELVNSDEETHNNFEFRLKLKDIDRFTEVLIPSLKMNQATIEGNINSDKNALVLNAAFPKIQYNSLVLNKYTLNVSTDQSLNFRNQIDDLAFGDQLKVYNLAFNADAAKDVLDSKFSWNNFGEISYSGTFNSSTKFYKQKNNSHVEISVKPSRIYVADSLWQINSALISIDSSLVRVKDFKLSSKSQYVLIDGAIDKNDTTKLNLHFNEIDMNSLNRFMGDDLALKGELNGELSVLDIYRKPMFLADLKINGLSLLEQALGEASVMSRWDRDTEEINAELMVESNKKKSLLAYGIYNPAKDSLSFNMNFDHFSLLILQPLMGSSFTNFHGDATGKVRVYGSIDHIQHDGALYTSNAGLMLSEMQVNYALSDSVKFSGDKIIFPDIKFHDDYGNTGIFSGSIKHQSFSKMIYDMTVKTDKILAINTTPSVNEQFYGKTFASGVVRITGKGVSVLIDGIGRTEKGTDMNISLEYEEDAQEYDFLSFVSRGIQPIKIVDTAPLTPSNLQMKFNIEITPEAKAQLIYNSKIGDVIRSQGSGNMQVTIDNDNNISLFGEYTVTQGDYLFTLQNVINKKFEIQNGGTIEWNGDPTEATLNLNAIYRLKASLRELFASIYENTDLSQRIPVLCKVNLTKSLSNPEIKFDIELPSAEDRIRDEVRQYISSEEDMNKQILSLLVLGKFYTPEYLRGTYTASNSNLVGSTASELLSNQFSNWLSQISNDFDIGVNYRPGNEITNDEIELALSTQMFNDRVSINGNIGNNSSQRTNANNNGFVGDADVNVKITNNGKLQLKAYNHANNTLIYETSPYTQGVGISYREDFNNLDELWQKLKRIFYGKASGTKVKDN